jgi:hypothetical protein
MLCIVPSGHGSTLSQLSCSFAMERIGRVTWRRRHVSVQEVGGVGARL